MNSHTHFVICLVSFLDYGILERHSQLDNTIGVLDMEMESYELSKLMAWIFYPTWILLTIIQAVCFILYNGKFHPLSKILGGCSFERKGMSQSKNLDYVHVLFILHILSFIYFSLHSTDNITETKGHQMSDKHTENMESET